LRREKRYCFLEEEVAGKRSFVTLTIREKGTYGLKNERVLKDAVYLGRALFKAFGEKAQQGSRGAIEEGGFHSATGAVV